MRRRPAVKIGGDPEFGKEFAGFQVAGFPARVTSFGSSYHMPQARRATALEEPVSFRFHDARLAAIFCSAMRGVLHFTDEGYSPDGLPSREDRLPYAR
jgi:hypothetical protein